MLNKIKQRCTSGAGRLQSEWMGRRRDDLLVDRSFSDAIQLFSERNKIHAYMHHYFSQIIPSTVKDHRNYFKQGGRGFGEDAFHAMWYLLLREFRPFNCLEIGVYRGQTISLWALLSRLFDFPCRIHGISPFTPAGDSVSIYLSNIDYKADTIKNHEAFGLPCPELLEAFSTDKDAVNLIRENDWDMIYIDGSHDYDIALADFEVCKENLADGGLLIMDDSSLYTDFNPPMFSFAGHPGPSQVVKERAFKELHFVGGVGHNNIFRKI